MSSGIRRLEKKTGSAGMRNLGSRLNNRPNSAPRPGNSTSRSDNAPLAAAAAAAAAADDTRGSLEYTLMSSTQPARTHHVMRMLTSKAVDLQTFTAPVKLRRRNKEYYRLKNKKRNEEKAEALEAEEAKKRQQLEADGMLMEVDGVEAKKEESAVPLYMVKEKPKVDINLIADRGGARSNKRNLFKKKTKQVFFADEEKRRLDIEEARPWVLEDDDEKEVWTGSLEGGQSSTYVLFVLTDDGFKVVPVDRWYKFTPKLKYKTLTLDEAEEELKRAQKSEAQDRWIMHKRMVRLDVNPDGEPPEGPGGSERSRGGGGGGGGGQASRSKLVEREIDDDIGFDDDDDDDDEGGSGKGKAPKKRGGEDGRRGGGEDFDFEMEFDDDEELGDVRFEYNEEEATQKKEQRELTNGVTFGFEEEEEEDDQAASKDKFAARRNDLRKSLRKREGRSEYKSDDEDANPYLTPSESDSDEEDEEEEDKKKEPEKPEDADKKKDPASGAQLTGKPATTSAAAAAAAAAAKKRKRVSVAPTGHQHHARASSPASAASASSGDGRKHFKSAASPASSSGSPPPSSPASADLITKQEIVDLIKSGVNTTKKLITCVRKKLKANPANKVRIQAIVKEVATLKDGELALKRA
ncbi:transcription factor IIF subunit tfg1 [Coemansia furcata]|uniref:Transcription factor IIF subunit tfg1 n=1 Tax=Coemansia furcata TaxID=417177 RepID=A0ACC1LS21_9FUNG|nr:transcription factor IIF subunit tfg1 [Coemansia furcata]